MSLPLGRPSWWSRARCAGLLGDPAWRGEFFPTRDVGAANHGAAAKRICASCPVWRECLTEAVDRGETEGIWAGAGGSLLRRLRRARRAGIESWQAALVEHRRLLDWYAGRERSRPSVANRNGAGAEDGLISAYVKGSRSEASQWAAAGRYTRRAG